MSIERQFAEKLDGREDIKLFMKLPAKFKVPTPVGEYNPGPYRVWWTGS